MYDGLLFGGDGVCKSIPGTDAISPDTTARVFPVVEKMSWIWVWTGDPVLDDPALIPDAPELGDPAWVMRADALDYAADQELIDDNLCDLSHLDFVDETTLGFASGSKWADERYLYATCVEARIATMALIEAINATFTEDKQMIEAQARIWEATPPDRPKALIPQDEAPAIFRRIVARRIAAE